MPKHPFTKGDVRENAVSELNKMIGVHLLVAMDPSTSESMKKHRIALAHILKDAVARLGRLK